MTNETLGWIIAVFVSIFVIESCIFAWVAWLSPKTRRIKRQHKQALAELDALIERAATERS